MLESSRRGIFAIVQKRIAAEDRSLYGSRAYWYLWQAGITVDSSDLEMRASCVICLDDFEKNLKKNLLDRHITPSNLTVVTFSAQPALKSGSPKLDKAKIIGAARIVESIKQ